MLDSEALPVKIVMADLKGDRSYILVFAAHDGAIHEIYLAGAGWPGEFTGFMTPSIRNQTTGTSAELPWQKAERIGELLQGVLQSDGLAKEVAARAKECIDALIRGKRYGV